MRWEELEQQPCSLARTLSVVGDRWTLLVLRECFLGVRRFDEFEKRLGITRHVLAERLKKLVDAGVLSKQAYQQRPLREEYRLTEKGHDLYPAVLARGNWGDRPMSDFAVRLVNVLLDRSQRIALRKSRFNFDKGTFTFPARVIVRDDLVFRLYRNGDHRMPLRLAQLLSMGEQTGLFTRDPTSGQWQPGPRSDRVA